MDDGRPEEPDQRGGSHDALHLRSLPKLLPGTARNAPKRNVLVVLSYLLVCVLAVGLLRTIL